MSIKQFENEEVCLNTTASSTPKALTV